MAINYHEIREVTVHAYTLTLNVSMVRAFKQFADLYLNGSRMPLKKGEIGLTNSQYANFQNLRYFGLIKQHLDSQRWSLTDFGEKFYFGEAQLHLPIAYMASETLPDHHPAWSTFTGSREWKRIDEIDCVPFKTRAEYQEEASPLPF